MIDTSLADTKMPADEPISDVEIEHEPFHDPVINLEKVARLLGPTAGSGRTVRLLGGGLFDLEKGMNGGSTKTGCKSQDGGAGEGEPMLGVASPFVRLRDGRIVPLRTLNEEQGDFVCLTHFPKPQEEDNPNLRLARVVPYIRSLMPTFLTRMRCVDPLRCDVRCCIQHGTTTTTARARVRASLGDASSSIPPTQSHPATGTRRGRL